MAFLKCPTCAFGEAGNPGNEGVCPHCNTALQVKCRACGSWSEIPAEECCGCGSKLEVTGRSAEEWQPAKLTAQERVSPQRKAPARAESNVRSADDADDRHRAKRRLGSLLIAIGAGLFFLVPLIQYGIAHARAMNYASNQGHTWGHDRAFMILGDPVGAKPDMLMEVDQSGDINPPKDQELVVEFSNRTVAAYSSTKGTDVLSYGPFSYGKLPLWFDAICGVLVLAGITERSLPSITT